MLKHTDQRVKLMNQLLVGVSQSALAPRGGAGLRCLLQSSPLARFATAVFHPLSASCCTQVCA